MREPDAYESFRDGRDLLASGNAHAAAVALERARDLEPEQASVRETLARAYYRTNRYAAAAEEFAAAVELDPVNDYAHFGLGLAFRQLGDLTGARRHLRIATVMRPDNVDYQQALAGVVAADPGAPAAAAGPDEPPDEPPAGLVTFPVACCDLDGVIWRGDDPIPGAAAGVAELRAGGVRVVFVTNNSSGTRADYAAKLVGCGVPAEPDDVLSSAMAAARLLRADLAPGSRVLSYAGAGVHEALEQAGLVPVDAEPVDAVVVGFQRAFDFDRLAAAADAIRSGARFIATNLDPTYPTATGLVPGTGALAAALATASGRSPEVAGKPHEPMAALVVEVCGPHGVMIGDRPSSDGAFAAALGWPFALVLSGIAGTAGEEAVPDPAPPFVAVDLGALAPRLLEAAQAAGPRSR